MPTIQLPLEAILEATDQLDLNQIDALTRRLNAARRNHKKAKLQEEIRLLRQKCEALTLSPSQWARYFQLVDARRGGTATPANRDEFLQLAAQAQDKANERLQLVADFAARHQLSLPEATRKLGLKTPDPIVL